MQMLKRVDKLLLVAVLLVFHAELVIPENAQEGDSNRSAKFRVVEHYPTISIDAQVISNNTGTIISDLKHGDFIISEDSKPQFISSFWRKLVTPLSFVILLDVATIEGNSQNLNDRVQTLKSALNVSMKPGDEVSIMALTETPTLLQDYTADTSLMLAALDRALQRKGSMKLPPAKRFRVALHEATKQSSNVKNPDARRVIVLISDLPERLASEIEVPEWLFRSFIDPPVIFCWQRSGNLSLKRPAEEMTVSGRKTLADMIVATGGELFGGDWGFLMERLRERYRLAYYADTLGRSGELVRIKLEVRPRANGELRDYFTNYRQFAIVPSATR